MVVFVGMLPLFASLTDFCLAYACGVLSGWSWFIFLEMGGGRLRIKKVINNNILCVVDEKGQEMIVTGKGLGFKRKTGERVDPALVEKTYRMEDKAEQRKLRELCQQIPLEHLRMTQELIEYIKTQLTTKLNESLLVTMADHISFAIKRKKEGVEFTNPLQGAIMCYYPAEYRLGQRCLREIQRQLHVELNESEAAFIALHIVNAELNTNMTEMYDITRLIEGTLAVAEYYYQRTFDRESLDFSRFVVHLRYFAQRLFQEKALQDSGDENDASFQQMIAMSCKQHYKCAQCIAEYILNTYHKTLSGEELIYLTIHLKRINSTWK